MKYTCVCGNEENMEHIYYCKILSEEKEKTLKFGKIYNGNLTEQIEVFRLFENNMKMREIMKNSNNIPCGLTVDPLSAMTVIGNQ